MLTILDSALHFILVAPQEGLATPIASSFVHCLIQKLLPTGSTISSLQKAYLLLPGAPRANARFWRPKAVSTRHTARPAFQGRLCQVVVSRGVYDECQGAE